MTCLARATFEGGNINSGGNQIADEFIALSTSYTTSKTGSPVVQNTVFKHGAYALSCPTGGNYVDFNCGALLSTTVHFHKFWFRFSKAVSFVTKNFWAMDAGGFGFHVALRLNSSYLLVATNNEGSPSSATGATELLEDTWYELQIEAKNHSTTGYIKVWIDGNLEINLTAIDTIRSVGAVGGVRLGSSTANGDDFYFDDYFYNDSLGASHNTMPPIGRQLLYLRPNANGDTNQYTSSTSSANHADDVDDDPSEVASSSARVNSTALNNVELFNFPAVSDITDFSALIHAVGVLAYIRNGTTPRQQILLKINSIEYPSGSDVNNTGTNAIIRGRRYETNPDTAADWTVAECDSLQAGVKQTAASGVQVAELMSYALVFEYTPATQYDQTFDAKARILVENDETFTAKARVQATYDAAYSAKLGWVQTFLVSDILWGVIGIIGSRVPPIERLRLWIAKTGSGTAPLRHLIKLAGQEIVGSYNIGASGASQLFYHDWPLNPLTEDFWTIEDLDLLQVGQKVFAGGVTTRVNGVFVVLEHNEAHALDMLFGAKVFVQQVNAITFGTKLGNVRVPGDSIFGAKIGFFSGHRTFPIGPVSREEPPLEQRLIPSANP